ncbi:MAG: dienelactone hydrolase family protein [Proteobacteria bacterium]|nr:dienelactone hydrolase family protein [Pseudomonadota bacterium]
MTSAVGDPAQHLTLEVPGAGVVSARWQRPQEPYACYVLAHGAGAGMEHPAMRELATGLAANGVATLRFQFPYMERGSRRPDPPPLCHAAVRAAVACAAGLAPQLALFAGGRSFGGRMTSQAQALEPLARVRALVFLGFPLHPAGAPGVQRAAHLDDVRVPMLFVQGSRDTLATAPLLDQVLARLQPRAQLQRVEGADHSFHVAARSGLTDAQVRAALLRDAAAWMVRHS